MKVLLDTNVVLDVLLERRPFVQEAERLFSAIEKGALNGYLCATTLTTVFYLAAKSRGARTAQQLVEKLLRMHEVAAVNRPVLEDACTGKGSDFEDNVLVAAAIHSGCDALVTRDPAGFKHASLKVFSPAGLLQSLAKE